jgi:hypothetical protein
MAPMVVKATLVIGKPLQEVIASCTYFSGKKTRSGPVCQFRSENAYMMVAVSLQIGVWNVI